MVQYILLYIVLYYIFIYFYIILYVIVCFYTGCTNTHTQKKKMKLFPNYTSLDIILISAYNIFYLQDTVCPRCVGHPVQ